jgi:hypothetical protein
MLDRIQADLKSSMLAKDAPRTQALRMLLAGYKNEAIAKNLGPQGLLAEADAVAMVKRLVSQREDSIEQFTKGGALDWAASERAEMEILKAYLPAMLEGVQLEEAVRTAIAETGAQAKKDMGMVMKALQAKHGGAYDGKAASQIVQSLLN